MKVLCTCGKFYLSEGQICPKCGHTLTALECAEYLAETGEKPARRADDKRPVSAVLISTETRRSAVGTISHAIFSGAILGGGRNRRASTATHATFSVMYASGRTGTETVEIHSKRFRELNALLHN